MVLRAWFEDPDEALLEDDPELRVLCEDRITAEARLSLVATVRQVLHTGLEALGLEAPEAM